MENDIEFVFTVSEQDVKDILVASLSQMGFQGFEENPDELIAYIKEADLQEEEVKEIAERFHTTYTKKLVEKQNWNALWESNFSPVLVDNFCYIRADFHPAIPNVKYDVIITPKMSFGTGHHATTYMMVQQMKELDFDGRKVADFGTGTGILAILAEKLGASYIWANDIDDWSIENAEENIRRNNCSNIVVENKTGFKPQEKFDIVLANINRNIILENLAGLVFGLNFGGSLVVSGILKTDETDLVEVAESHNLQHLKTVEKDKWISILFKK